MTTQGGTTGAGVIFSYDPVIAAYNNLKDFGSNIQVITCLALL
jgi:hypothetical protein